MISRTKPDISSNSNSTNNNLSPSDYPVHNWYRFVLSYPPHLVRSYLERFGVTPDHQVLDPFCGTGTTVVECKKLGIPSIGVEAFPVSHFASQVKLDWSPDPDGILLHAQGIASATYEELEKQGINDDGNIFKDQVFELRTLSQEIEDLLLTNSISPLPLHKTLTLIDKINEKRDDRYFNHERLALAKALVGAISNLRFGPEVGIGPAKHDSPVVAPWLNNIRKIAEDLAQITSSQNVSARILRADARLIRALLAPNSIDAVITSPPYPNEKDYTRTTRLESVLLGFINSKAELQAYKRDLLRSNTRTIYVGDNEDHWATQLPSVKALAETIEARRIELNKTSGFEKLYGTVTRQYFGGMAKHLVGLKGVLRKGANLAYVVGDQASYFQVLIPTGEILSEIAEHYGYEVIGIDLFRTRLATVTKRQMREEVVVLRWPGETRKAYSMSDQRAQNRYNQIVERCFFARYREGDIEVTIERSDFEQAAQELGIPLPKNLGDIVYSVRYRSELPESIRSIAPVGQVWIIRPAGRGVYTFVLTRDQPIAPNTMLTEIKVPDATPG